MLVFAEGKGTNIFDFRKQILSFFFRSKCKKTFICTRM